VAARQLGMSEQDIFDLALARSAWRCMVVVQLGAGNVRLSWSKTPISALMNLSELAHASAFAGVDRERILYDESAPTALERADGNWASVARLLECKAVARRRRSPPSRRTSIGISRRPSGSRVPGRTTGD
jgi:hypothetical protein